MRSARTVSRVIRMMLGLSVAAAASAGNRTTRQRMEARRIKGKGICSLADSLFGTKRWSRRLENDFRSNLRGTRAALRKERVAGGYVRCLRVVGEACVWEVVEPTLVNCGAARERIEVRMVQQVENLEAELEAHPFRDLGSLVEVQVPLLESGSTERIPAARPNSVWGRNGKYRRHIRNRGRSGVTELVNRFHARTVWPLINEILAGL